MSDADKKFHEFALYSVLFKSRSEWYFCYLKSEKIAHVLGTLSRSVAERPLLAGLTRASGELPATIAHFAAGEIDASVVLADIFALLSSLRLSVTEGSLSEENSLLLLKEYEGIAERIVLGSRPSPFGTAEDFAVPPLSTVQALPSVKDTRLPAGMAKGQHKGQKAALPSEGQRERLSTILDFVRKHKGVSIKDISSVIKNCSEKTIQRQLTALLTQGLIRKVGERRWSQYLAA